MAENKRKGARSQKDIPATVLEQLNKGLIESANLTEWLSVDHVLLIKNVLPKRYKLMCLDAVDSLKTKSTMSIIKVIGKTLYNEIIKFGDDSLFGHLKIHTSDSVRCWCAYIVGSCENLSVLEKLELIQSFAADSHFGVREIAWMAVRDEIAENLEVVLPLLETWSVNENPNIRRFSCESIRPNGVWYKKIDKLKTNPDMALCILNNLKSDVSRYVQDSVGNWLNDAAKTQPEFVIELCNRWNDESKCKETNYIIKRSIRSIKPI